MKTKTRTPLKILLFERSLSLDDLAKMSGVGRTTIWHATNGVASEETKTALATALDVPIESIFPERVRA